MTCNFDEIDLKIIKSLSEDCRKSTTQVAEEAEISRPTAIARIHRLAAEGLLDFSVKVDLTKMGFKLAIVEIETKGKEEEDKNMANRLRACPRVVQFVRKVGKPEYTAFVCAEDSDTLLSAIDCLRTVLSAKISSWQRAMPVIGVSFNLNVFFKKCELTPCGKKCGICPSFKESVCVGCPAVNEYKGPL